MKLSAAVMNLQLCRITNPRHYGGKEISVKIANASGGKRSVSDARDHPPPPPKKRGISLNPAVVGNVMGPASQPSAETLPHRRD